MIKITYVTITFNAAAVLRRTLDSVLSQDYPEITHLIIDGASTDDTMKIVDDYIERSNAADNGHRIHVTSEPDKGIYDAMNKGLRSVDGDYVCFLNAGDFLPSPNTVSHLIAAVARSSSAGLLPEGRKNSKLSTLNSPPFSMAILISSIPTAISFIIVVSHLQRISLGNHSVMACSSVIRLFMPVLTSLLLLHIIRNIVILLMSTGAYVS